MNARVGSLAGRVSSIGIVLSTGLLAGPPARAEIPLIYRTVALTGDEIPGTPGLTFAWLVAAPVFGGGGPRISPEGVVSFGGGWTTAFPFPHGIFRESGGTLELLARDGDPATGTTVAFQGFPAVAPGAPRVSGVMYSFDATVTVSQFQEDGVWANRDAGRELIFLQSQQPPGTAAGSRWFQWYHTLEGDGHVVVLARYSNGGSSHINQTGFWRDSGSGLNVIALGGEPAPGTGPGVVFGNGTPLALLPFQTWDVDSAGHVAFNAMVMGGGVTEFNDEGIWSESGTGPGLVVREGDAAPGTLPGAVFMGLSGYRTFGSSQVSGVVKNETGGLVFGAHVDAPGIGYPYASIWTTRTGALEHIALGRLPDEGGPGGDPAPGFPEGTVFHDFVHNVMNDQGEIAFTASVTNFGPGEGIGIWVDRGPGLELLVRGSQPVPDLPGATFSFPVPILYHNSGHVLFQANVTGGFGSGLFLASPEGEIQPVVITNRLFEVGPGDLRFASELRIGIGASDELEIPFHLLFTDGSGGVFTARLDSGVGAPESIASAGARLVSVGPNPFRSRADVTLELPAPENVRIDVFDAGGRLVRRLLDGRLGTGRHGLSWEGADESGAPVPAGVYFVRMAHGGGTASGKLMRLR